MVLNLYESILHELGEELSIPLKPDSQNSCFIQFKKEGVGIYIELIEGYIVIAANVGNLPRGDFREKLLHRLLIENGLPPPKAGIFSYLVPENSLFFHRRIYAENLRGRELHEEVKRFLPVAQKWREGIETMVLPEIDLPAQPAAPFGRNLGLRL